MYNSESIGNIKREVNKQMKESDIEKLKAIYDHMEGAIFDLDGVIADTAQFHYMAWKRLANQLGFDFKEEDNERLKGVSRMDSLNILLEIGDINLDDEEKRKLASLKNQWYVEYISGITEEAILPGAKDYLIALKKKGTRIALGSASKNARLILDNVGLTDFFEVIVDGTIISAAKPDPQVFMKGADGLGVAYNRCVVFEDSEAGIEAAIRGQMHTIGIGDSTQLKKAELVVDGLYQLLGN